MHGIWQSTQIGLHLIISQKTFFCTYLLSLCFSGQGVIQCRDLVKLLQFLNLKQSESWAVELQECDLLDSTPLDISVHEHLLYS
jgi:hypothetical protein